MRKSPYLCKHNYGKKPTIIHSINKNKNNNETKNFTFNDDRPALSGSVGRECLDRRSTAIGYFDNNSHVQGVEIPSTISLQVGDLIVVTANVTGNYWNTVNVCKANGYWPGDALLTLASNIASEDGKQFFIPVSTEILSALENGNPQNYLYFDGNDYTLTSVDVTHGNANLFTRYISPSSPTASLPSSSTNSK